MATATTAKQKAKAKAKAKDAPRLSDQGCVLFSVAAPLIDDAT
jgi:hypothetical protein